MSMASGYKQTLLSDSFIISLCEGPSGRISSTLSLILNPKQKKSNTTLNYKLSIWIGALEFGSFLFHKDPSDSDKCKFDAGRVKILWSPLGDHLCIVFENEIIFIDIIYKLNGASNICLQEALHWLDHDTSYSDSIVAQVKLVKRVNESTTATGVTINMGRFLAIGGQNGRLLKYYWDGDFISEISFTNIHVVLPVTSLVTSQLEHVSIVEERSENSKLSTNPKNISSKLDDIEGNNSLYIESWSERTCTLAARYHDGSLLLILLVGSKCFATSRFHPVLLSKQSQYADLTHPNRDGFGKQFFSVVMNSVELSQRKNAQGLQASHTNRQSVQLSQPLESVSKLVHCQLIDSPIACEPDNLLLVCLVYTRHFPSEFMTPRTAAFYGPSGGVATATEPGVDTFIDLSHPHTLSVVIIRAHYHSKESTQVESGSVISDGKVKSNGRPRGVHSNIDLTVTSICPIRDLVHANKATVGAPNERRMDGRGPVTFEILHLPQELRLLLLVDGTLTCRSLPDLSNIYFIIDTTVISPTPSFYGSSTSRYHFAVTHGALVISSSQKYLPEHLSDAGQEHQLKIKPVLPKYESTISNVQLITSCHGPLSTQASSVLLSLDDSPSLYVHYIHDLPIGPPTLRQGSEDPRELRESVDKYMSLDWDETPRDIMLTSDSLDYTYKTSHSMHASTAHRTQKIQDSFGEFLSVKLPFRLVSALRAYSARLGTDGRAQPGYAEPTLQTGLIVAQSVLGENKHMQSQYLAVAVGGPSIPPSHNHSAIAAASPHTTTEISTIWLHNCHTRRWREVYLDISSDMRHDKCYGRVQLIVELRVEDMINTPVTAITQNDSFREFFHGTLCGHLSSIAGPLQAVIGLSW